MTAPLTDAELAAIRERHERAERTVSSSATTGTHADRRTLLRAYQELAQENEKLRGMKPELPPRPPHGEGLPRFGLRHNVSREPLSVPMDDGYWTPWHLADRLRARNAKLLAALRDVMPLLTECDCIYSDRDEPLCPCRAARAAIAQQHDPKYQPIAPSEREER